MKGLIERMKNNKTALEDLKNNLVKFEKSYKKHPDFKKKIAVANKILNLYKAKAEEPLKVLQASLTVCMNSIKECNQIYEELYELLGILDMKDLKLVDKTADAYLTTFKKMISDGMKDLYNECNK